MTQWLKPGARLACRLAQTACISALLVGALSGCNEDKTPAAGSTFDAVVKKEEPKGPVEGIVTAVPGTEGKTPVTTGGGAIPLPTKAGRFTEVAPDTTGGETFWSSPAYEYDLGNLVAMRSEDSAAFSAGNVFITPVRGWVRYPRAAASPTAAPPFPIIILLHGNHPDQLSYQGYDYLAEDLSTHGYVVLSINADDINYGKGYGDTSSQSRGQLVLGSLDRLRQINDNGQIDEKGRLGSLNALKGKLDFERIGIMGHSRGGQGISNAILFNKTRRGVAEADLIAALKNNLSSFSTDFPKLGAAVVPAKDAIPETLALDGTVVTPAIEAKPATIDDAILKEYHIFYASGGEDSGKHLYSFKAAFMLAPTDFGGNTALNEVPLLNLLPSCDGDMRDLEGARAYDHNRFGPTNDTAPRYQIFVNGTNHNFYNTIWTQDGDDNPNGDATEFCKFKRSAGTESIRLNAEDTRRHSRFLIESFMRYHVGGETKFAAYWNGTAQLPDVACPSGIAPCDERVLLVCRRMLSKPG